jgi:ADP-ribose pyrophosphatase YjhB (NUDIX family)
MTTENAVRETGPWPRAGVSMAVFRDSSVLLIKRGKGAYRGLWSLPGGHIEPGETARDAALREVLEETRVTARVDGLADVHDIILRGADGTISAHYVLPVFFGTWVHGIPAPASDAVAASFVPIDALAGLALTPDARRIIEGAHAALLATARARSPCSGPESRS